MTITRLELLTSDLPATLAFYRDIPELPLLHADDLTATFEAGHTRLVFRQAEDIQPVYHFAFTILPGQLETALTQLKNKTGIMLLPEGGTIADFSNWNAKAFYFYDNNGNILEYIVRYDLDIPPAQPSANNGICCISEIGLVTDDVPALAAQISDGYGIPFFSKQPRQDHFTVLGDDRSLFIIVVRERHWYPTSIAADTYPTVIGFKDATGQDRELYFGFQ